jgi:DNA-binding ferritin-like protein (Dps family)
MLKRLNHLPYHAVWHNTENMVAIDKGTPIEQGMSTLIATFNNMIDFYPKTVAADKQANSLLPDVFDWYKVVGYLAAVPQDLPVDEANAYNSDIGFGRISRATFPFVGTQTMSPQAFYEELTRRLFFMHKSSGLPVSGSLASDHTGASTFNVNEPGAVLGVYDQASDNYVSGFRGLKNLNNYYKLLRQENDLRLAQSNVNSETDLEDLERIFTNAISLLQAQKEALKDVTDTIGQDMIDLTNTLEAYHDPYQTSSTIRDLQLRYVQLSSENRAQGVLEATYQAFAPLLTAVRTLSQSVSQKQIEYQNLLSAYNVRFEAYLSNYESWNTLVQRAEDLFGGATTYMDLLQGRLDLIASVGQLRAKFNADVSQINSIVTSVQQTYLLLKSQGVRTIGNFATGSTFQLNGVTYSRPRAAIGSFSVENFLNFVPK